MPDPARAAVAEVRRPVITEKQLQEAVIQCARLLGYEVYHTFDSRRSAAGFPDLVMVSRSGAEVHIWYPHHWTNGHIERVLSGRERAGGTGEESEG